jgi:hypothetical protein
VFSAVLGKTSVFVFAFIWSGYDWRKCFDLGSVFCCHLEPKTGRLAVTGAEDEMAYVWETLTGDVVLHCKGHKVGAVFEVIQCYDVSCKGRNNFSIVFI